VPEKGLEPAWESPHWVQKPIRPGTAPYPSKYRQIVIALRQNLPLNDSFLRADFLFF
jgi:hypothetical protein